MLFPILYLILGLILLIKGADLLVAGKNFTSHIVRLLQGDAVLASVRGKEVAVHHDVRVGEGPERGCPLTGESKPTTLTRLELSDDGPSPTCPRKLLRTLPSSSLTMVSDREAPASQQRTEPRGV